MIVVLNGEEAPEVDSVLIYLDDTESSYIESTKLGEFKVVGMTTITYGQDRDAIVLTIGE